MFADATEEPRGKSVVINKKDHKKESGNGNKKQGGCCK